MPGASRWLYPSRRGYRAAPCGPLTVLRAAAGRVRSAVARRRCAASLAARASAAASRRRHGVAMRPSAPGPWNASSGSLECFMRTRPCPPVGGSAAAVSAALVPPLILPGYAGPWPAADLPTGLVRLMADPGPARPSGASVARRSKV